MVVALAATPVLLPVDEPARVALSGAIYLVALLTLRALPQELVALLPGRHGNTAG